MFAFFRSAQAFLQLSRLFIAGFALLFATTVSATPTLHPDAPAQETKAPIQQTTALKTADDASKKISRAQEKATPSKREKVSNTSIIPQESKPFWMHRFNKHNWPIQFFPSLEFGFLAPLSHTIRFGNNGTDFDYIKDGGQDNLFTFLRLSADLVIAQHHIVTFLYQPIDIRTQVILRGAFRTDQTTFAAGQPIDTRYGFDFFRISYMYDIFRDADRELGFGVSLQIRNAAIIFSSVDGRQRAFRNDIGPVPVLKTRGRFMLPQRFWIGFEIDGFYAPVSFLNGSDQEVVGAILDASLRVGKELTPLVDIFLNFRYLGGGASGRDNNTGEPGADGFVNNWLHFFIVSVGFALR